MGFDRWLINLLSWLEVITLTCRPPFSAGAGPKEAQVPGRRMLRPLMIGRSAWRWGYGDGVWRLIALTWYFNDSPTKTQRLSVWFSRDPISESLVHSKMAITQRELKICYAKAQSLHNFWDCTVGSSLWVLSRIDCTICPFSVYADFSRYT